MYKIVLIFFLTVSLNFSTPSMAGALEESEAAYSRGEYKTAIKLLRPLAEGDEASAQLLLGKIYLKLDKLNVAGRNLEEALTWLDRAAAQGNAEAQYSLGHLYGEGKGVERDYAIALKWFKLAGAQGDASAQYNVGLYYEQGRGVPRDRLAALKWYQLAAAQGVPAAQNNLGRIYSQGVGIPQDLVEAYMWYNLAASASDPEIARSANAGREAIVRQMSPKQLEEGRQRSAEWKPTPSKLGSSAYRSD